MPSRRAPRRSRLLAAVAAIVVLAGGCAGGDGDGGGGGGTVESAADPSATEPAVSGGGAGSAADTTVAAEDPLTIGLVAPSAVDDASFTQSMVESLDALAAERPVEVMVVAELPSPDDALPVAQLFAEDGADVVIVHGSQFRSVVAQLADEFPDVSFAWGTEADDTGRPNVFAYSAQSDQGGYVNGVIAAGLTTSGAIGAVGPIAVGDARRYMEGFGAGVASVDPALTVNVTYIDSYTDVTLAREAAEVMAAFGNDVLTGTAQLVVGPIEVAVENGIPWLGTQASQVALAPERVVASQVYHWEVALAQMLDLIDAGTTGGALEPLTLANGGLTIEFNPAADLPAGVRDAADAAIDGLSDGTVATGVG